MKVSERHTVVMENIKEVMEKLNYYGRWCGCNESRERDKYEPFFLFAFFNEKKVSAGNLTKCLPTIFNFNSTLLRAGKQNRLEWNVLKRTQIFYLSFKEKYTNMFNEKVFKGKNTNV